MGKGYRMNIATYEPHDHERLRPIADRLGRDVALSHAPFVNHFYATRDSSRLHLFTLADGTIGGTLGLESLRFEHLGRELTIGSPTNFYGFHPGAGGYLFLHWMKSFKIGMVFGGSADTHRILQQQRWTYYPGMKTYLLNRAYSAQPGDAFWKSAARWALEQGRSRLQRFENRFRRAAPRDLSVCEEQSYGDDLLPRRSPFTFRFAPRVDYLAWRYDTRLCHVRYRLFRIRRGNAPAGYVILNDQPTRIVVAHCDGEDAADLAYGIALSVAEAARADRAPREVMLTSCHPEMQAIFKALGFRAARQERPFALGSLRHRDLLPPPDASGWLINFDIADNGLRPPFLNQQTAATVAAR